MKRTALLILVLLLGRIYTYAARPTVHASSFIIAAKECSTMRLQWVAGNGAARTIVARQDSPVDWAPVDGTVYSAYTFGTGPTYGPGNDNYIIYNSGNGFNFTNVINLLPGHRYYFAIFEQDNSSNPEYYTTGAPTVNDSTYYINFNYDIQYHDSCQIRNSYTFTNRSYSNIPNLKYTFHFDKNNYGDSSMSNPVTHSYTGSGYTPGFVPSMITANTNMTGCVNFFVKNLKVYQKVVAMMDWDFNDDTVQCLDGNFFWFKTKAVTNPLSGSYGYRWFTQIDTTTFSFFKKTFPTDGKFKVSVEITTNISKGANQYPTNCKDTLSFYVRVLPSPVGNISVQNYDTVQCLKRNRFQFQNPDNTLTSYKWWFGDNDSSQLKDPVHSYAAIGTYRVIHEAVSSTGCKGKDTMYVKVLPDLDSKFTGLDTFYCSSNKIITLLPNTKGGKFEGYPHVLGDTLIPDVPNNYHFRYVVKTQFCSDTTFFDFKIQKTPQPNIGKDTALCSTSSFNVSANEPGAEKYQWNTGEITEVKTVTASGLYFVDVTNGQCTGTDSIHILYTTAPKVKLGSDTVLCKGASFKLVATSPNANYLWNDGSTDSILYVFSPGLYTVTVTNPCGTTSASIYVNYQTEYCDLFMATAFSPGNDLINNVFMPRGRNIDVQMFQIYNRWGELVFQTTENNVGWDGTYKGEIVQEGLYIWKLFYTTPNGPYIKKSNAFGQILLLR